jgi:hypothetical protein
VPTEGGDADDVEFVEPPGHRASSQDGSDGLEPKCQELKGLAARPPALACVLGRLGQIQGGHPVNPFR